MAHQLSGVTAIGAVTQLFPTAGGVRTTVSHGAQVLRGPGSNTGP